MTNDLNPQSRVPCPGCRNPQSALAFLIWAIAAAAAIGWLAVQIQVYFAPLFVFPLLVGLALGAALVGGLRATSLAHRPTALAGTLLAAVLLVGGQHYWSYRAALAARVKQQLDLDKARQAFPDIVGRLPPPPPAKVWEYLRWEAQTGRKLFGHTVRGAALWGWWALEAVLILLAAAWPMAWALRQPYCRHCRSWLRVTRRGRVSAGLAAELAEGCGLPHREASGPASYRLLTCRSGCSPSLFQLSWGQGSERHETWLDADRRRAVAAVLDRGDGG